MPRKSYHGKRGRLKNERTGLAALEMMKTRMRWIISANAPFPRTLFSLQPCTAHAFYPPRRSCQASTTLRKLPRRRKVGREASMSPRLHPQHAADSMVAKNCAGEPHTVHGQVPLRRVSVENCKHLFLLELTSEVIPLEFASRASKVRLPYLSMLYRVFGLRMFH